MAAVRKIMKIFGTHKIPLAVEHEGFSISAKQDKENIVYHRKCGSDEAERFILSKHIGILIHPVEPLNLPKSISSYLFTLFKTKVIIGPRTSRTIYIKFPIEIGVFLTAKNEYESIDILGLTNPKYTLYGDYRNGAICRYYESEVFSQLPSSDIYKEGVMELRIKNSSPEWVTVKQAVFSGFGMKIFFDDTRISMRAEMDIQSRLNAETDFNDKPPQTGMQKSRELFLTRKLPLITSKFIMRDGF